MVNFQKSFRYCNVIHNSGDWQTLSVKGQIGNIFSFKSHMVSVATTQFCHCNGETAIDSVETNEHGCALVKL